MGELPTKSSSPCEEDCRVELGRIRVGAGRGGRVGAKGRAVDTVKHPTWDRQLFITLPWSSFIYSEMQSHHGNPFCEDVVLDSTKASQNEDDILDQKYKRKKICSDFYYDDFNSL